LRDGLITGHEEARRKKTDLFLPPPASTGLRHGGRTRRGIEVIKIREKKKRFHHEETKEHEV